MFFCDFAEFNFALENSLIFAEFNFAILRKNRETAKFLPAKVSDKKVAQLFDVPLDPPLRKPIALSITLKINQIEKNSKTVLP